MTTYNSKVFKAFDSFSGFSSYRYAGTSRFATVLKVLRIFALLVPIFKKQLPNIEYCDIHS